MNRKELIKRELDDLDSTATEFMCLVQEELSIYRKSKVKLYLTIKDRYRLLNLRVWSERYRIPLSYIIQTLIPLWESFVQRHSKRMKKEGLNVRVSTLTGKKSLSMLLDNVKKDFPHQIQKRLFISSERERIFADQKKKQERINKDDIKVKSQGTTLLDFDSPKKYVRTYNREMKKESKCREKVAQEMKERPYRGNPFREETI